MINSDRNKYYTQVGINKELDFLSSDFRNINMYIKRPITMYKVDYSDIGNWDMLAKSFYGSNNELFYWAILLVNGIINPFDESIVGRDIKLIDKRDIYDFYDKNYNDVYDNYIE